MIIQSQNVKAILELTLNPVHIDYVSFTSEPLLSSILLTATSGAMLSFATSDTSAPNEIHSMNNLKMMSLLIRDKWSEDEQEQRKLPSRHNHSITWNNETIATNIYTYEIEDLHACTAQIPNSDLLLLFIADVGFPYGLLVMKMKGALEAFKDMYGYRLS